MLPTSPFVKRIIFTVLSLTLWSAALTVCGQTQPPNEVRELLPSQTIEREMTGAETHRYKFDLQANEFFQVRVEQKGVDVTLKLLDANGKTLATMDSPNGKEGFETLTWVATNSGSFVLEVINSDSKIEKGIYTIKREASREATGNDKQQVEIEKKFVEGVAAVIELSNEYQKADTILQENFKKPEKSKADAASARIKFKEVLAVFRSIKSKANDENLKLKLSRFGGKDSQQLLVLLKNIAIHTALNEALTLDRIAQSHYYLGEWNEYVEYKKLALIAAQDFLKFKDDLESSDYGRKILFAVRSSMAGDLDNLGGALYSRFGKFEESIKYYEQAVELYQTLYRETQDETYKIREAMALSSIAFSYDDQSKYKAKAIEYFTKSLEIFRTIPQAKSKVAEILSLIGSAYISLYDYVSARKNLEGSLEVYRELNDKSGQASILNDFAVMYLTLNNQPKFKEYMKQTLDILESPDYEENTKKTHISYANSLLSLSFYDDIQGENLDDLLKRTRLQKIAFCYELLKDYAKSLEYNKQFLEVARASKEPYAIRSGLRDVGYTLAKLERWNEAADYYQQALEISRRTQDKEAIAKDLQDTGWTLLEAGKYREALQYQSEALITYQSVGVDENKSFSTVYSHFLNEISRTHYALGNKRLAIFYGKRAVNAMQGERQRLQNLDAIAQKGFLEWKEKHYRRLADWLIAAGRLPEAEQVLRMLKEDEYFKFIRRDVTEGDKLAQRTELNKNETAALKSYNEISNRLAEIGVEYSKLEEKKNSLPEGAPLPPNEQKRLDELAKQIEEANKGFQAFLLQLAREFERTPKTNKVNEAKANSGLSADLRDWRREFGDDGVVALYTVVGEDRYRVILTTPDVQTDGKYEIKAEKLREKIAAFRQAVQNPNFDPRPLGKELYDIIVKPIEKQLEDAKAKTLLWSLDDTLRYVPLAALWDGKQYFGEKYQNVLITLASRTRLNEKSDPNWRVLGLGVSEPKQVNLTEPDGSTRSMRFDGLPGVREELQTIVRDETSQEKETGILPGRRLLNSTFTESALKERLGKGYKVVHIASHFSFRSGDLTNSFLLLGDGQALTLNKIKSNPQLAFTGVELLTLSACETAVGDTDADGVEVESFGVIAQDTGAKAVLATLWSVADESTSVLMGEFYRLRKEKPQLSKAAALQLAQQEMLAGALRPLKADGKQRGLFTAGTSFAYDPKRPYAHPYYWSPFILIGNWR